MIKQSIEAFLNTYRAQLFLQIFLVFLFLRPEHFLIPFPFPALYHGVLYYWILYHPNTVSLPFVLVASLFHDVLIGAPLGCTFLEVSFLGAWVWSQRKQLLQEPFILVWGYFAFCIALLISAKILLKNFQGGHFSFPMDLFPPFLWVACLYPFLSWFLSCMNRRFGFSHG